MEEENKVIHTFEPVYDKNSKILILGTMPSPKSRQNGFYYSHPQNRFWKVMAEILNADIPISIEEKRELMLENKIALWDVLHSCDIKGADDNSIKNPVPNDIASLLNKTDIEAVFTTGNKATSLYKKYCAEKAGRESIYLPSTSPANCRNYNFEKLVEEYRAILKYIKG